MLPSVALNLFNFSDVACSLIAATYTEQHVCGGKAMNLMKKLNESFYCTMCAYAVMKALR